MPKFMCVKDANSSQLREIWKTTAILSTELLKNHTTENHRCLWDNPAQLSTYIMDPELIWALWDTVASFELGGLVGFWLPTFSTE